MSTAQFVQISSWYLCLSLSLGPFSGSSVEWKEAHRGARAAVRIILKAQDEIYGRGRQAAQ